MQPPSIHNQPGFERLIATFIRNNKSADGLQYIDFTDTVFIWWNQPMSYRCRNCGHITRQEFANNFAKKRVYMCTECKITASGKTDLEFRQENWLEQAREKE